MNAPKDKWSKENVVQDNLKIPCLTSSKKDRQMAYWFWIPQKSKDYDKKEALKALLKKFDPSQETRKGIEGWKRQFSMCNCNVPKSLLSGKGDKEFGCVTSGVVFKERAGTVL